MGPSSTPTQILPSDWGDGYPNVWLGVTVEDGAHGVPRIDVLRTIPAKIRFLSCEPLLEDLGALDLTSIHWVIVGGESGPKARKMLGWWMQKIRGESERHGIPFFFKQWGGRGRDKGGCRILDYEVKAFPKTRREEDADE